MGRDVTSEQLVELTSGFSGTDSVHKIFVNISVLSSSVLDSDDRRNCSASAAPLTVQPLPERHHDEAVELVAEYLVVYARSFTNGQMAEMVTRRTHSAAVLVRMRGPSATDGRLGLPIHARQTPLDGRPRRS
jgi:hypothetical protein